MVKVPDELMAEHVIEQAIEYGEYGDVYDSAHEGQHGEYEFETEWSLSDIDPSECDVDMDGESVVITEMIEGHYSVKVASARYNPPGKAHPADYENREIPLFVSIEMKLGELPTPVINVEQG